jgi:hypothetical protein
MTCLLVETSRPDLSSGELSTFRDFDGPCERWADSARLTDWKGDDSLTRIPEAVSTNIVQFDSCMVRHECRTGKRELLSSNEP